ncbi:4'-phosphopantetheinyl transferase family protein [Pseudoduganella sp. S-14]|jgi:4'-phosphopantetheinyl transferase|uniref:4'-phosphopantetheinyl transferase family protein n=1 Tax=Pseudoduganella sp. S-14 TaxID=3404065 RepID=UPI003CECF38B
MARGMLLWLADADALPEVSLQRYLAWLTPGELARHGRFVREQRKRQFVAGRVLLRMALAPLLRVPPQQVLLEERSSQAPRLLTPAPGGSAPGFSISHSGRWVACAVGEHAVGLDIEVRDPARDLAALAKQAFDADEMARWQQMQRWDDAARIEGFYRLWSEKEARIKLGLAIGGHCVAVPHQELSVVLCSAVPLASVPQPVLVGLP